MIRAVLRAVLFDFNGVLVDDEPLHLALFQRVLAEEGIALVEADYYEHFLGFDDRDCFSAVLRNAGQEPTVPRVMRLIARKASYYQQHIREQGYPFFAGAAEVVRGASSSGCRLAVVSGALREEIEGALRQERLLDLFSLIVAAEDVSVGKPDSEGYRKALDGLNSLPPLPERLLHPHEVLAIEDSPAGLRAATDAGLRTLAVAQTYPPSELGLAERVVTRLADSTFAELAVRFR